MRILFLSCHLPYPPISGGRRREYELLTRLSRHHEIHLCCLSNTYEEDLEQAEHLRTHCAELDLFSVALVDDQTDAGYPVAPCPPQVVRHRSREATEHVAAALTARRFDLVHVEGYYLMPHLPSSCDPPIVLAEQNVECLLFRQRLAIASDEPDRARWREAFRITFEWERAAWRRAARCIAVTEDDAAAMRRLAPGLDVRVVPDGCDHLTQLDHVTPGSAPGPIDRRPDRPTVLYVGNFAYEPNVDAALHLVRDIFPRICEMLPEARLLLVGNAPPSAIRDLAEPERIVVTGLVPSLEPYFAAADIVLCPLRIGGGIKVKVLEALAHGKAVVTTSVGAQGLDRTSGEALVVRDDAADLARTAVQLLSDPRARSSLEAAARRYARTLPTWDAAAAALEACYDEVWGDISDRAIQPQRAP
ncbi:MAG TPA: glycosyltransferase family 4 protein, partial [Dehalococcoidia bacterium]|nr:glycosyltransferase family 4 protein [Dehalococcoidia bacterium]